MAAVPHISRFRVRWSRPDLLVRVVLGFLLAVQLLGPTCCVRASGAAPSELAALGRVVGHQVVLCHHGDPDRHGSDDHRDCCGCGLCSAVANGAPLAPAGFVLARPIGHHLVVVYVGPTRRVRAFVHLGAASPRGPPLAV